MSSAPPTRIVGRYELAYELASGGMATVYIGRLLGPIGFSPPVAIKRIHPWLATEPQFVSMFADEARLAARVRHANIVPTLDVVVEDGELLLVLEYVHGESLARLVRAAKEAEEPIDPSIVAAIAFGMLSGLHAAHEAKDERGRPLGVVHRDVSPQNVVVGTDGITRVLDFGVARAAGQVHTTRDGHLKGKLCYMAPEQARDERIDRRADIYAAGAVLWEMLTLRRPFSSAEETDLLALVKEGVTDPPSKHAEGIPPELDALVMRALARDPKARFATARDMAVALEGRVRLASPMDVAAWVNETARLAVQKRAEQIAAMEASPMPEVRVAPPAEVEPKPPERRVDRRAWIAGALGASVAIAGGVALVARGGGAPARAVPPVTSAAPLTLSSSVSSAPPAHAEEPPPSASSAPAVPVRSVPPRPRRDPCDPPYFYDSKGIKHYKVDCPVH